MTKNTLKNTCNFLSSESSLFFSLPPLTSHEVIFFFFFRSHTGQKPDGILICNSSVWFWEGAAGSWPEMLHLWRPVAGLEVGSASPS